MQLVELCKSCEQTITGQQSSELGRPQRWFPASLYFAAFFEIISFRHFAALYLRDTSANLQIKSNQIIYLDKQIQKNVD